MLYVGIDIASEKHDICIISQNNTKSFVISNDITGFNLLLSYLTETPENTKIGLEATGIYSTNLVAFLRRNGFYPTTINPLLLKKQLSATTLRKTKTDKIDAKFIAEQIRKNDYQSDQDISYHTSELKSLGRSRFYLVKRKSQEKVRCRNCLMIVFPEYSSFFSDIFGVTSSAILAAYPSAKDIAAAGKTKIYKIMKAKSRGRFSMNDAEELVSLAKNSIGTYSSSHAMSVSFCIQTIALLSQQIAELEIKMKQLLEEIESPILSVPGIGTVYATMILGEVGNFNKFENPNKLIAFAGLEPSINDSGKDIGNSGKMVKRGSPYLRWALIEAALSVIQYNPVFKSYYQKKRAQGKSHRVALSHSAKKLVRLLFALATKNTPFISSFCS